MTVEAEQAKGKSFTFIKETTQYLYNKYNIEHDIFYQWYYNSFHKVIR